MKINFKKINKFKLTLIITVVLAILAIILVLNSSTFTIKKELRDFAVSDTSSICKIFLADKKNNSVTLEKIDNKWIVNGKYPAQPNKIVTFLGTLKNIRVAAPVSKTAIKSIIASMATIGVKVEIYNDDYFINLFDKIKLFKYKKIVKTYYVGDEPQDNIGSYMLLENSSMPFLMYIPSFYGYLSSRYTTEELSWRDKALFKLKITEIKNITVNYINSKDSSFSLNYNGNRNFSLINLDNQQVVSNPDSIKILDLLTSFRNVGFDYFVNDKNIIDSLRSLKPYLEFSVTDTSNNIYAINAYRMKFTGDEIDEVTGKNYVWDRERLYAFINNNTELVTIQYFVFDPLIRPLKFYYKSNSN